jgi:hypothetical protein
MLRNMLMALSIVAVTTGPAFAQSVENAPPPAP